MAQKPHIYISDHHESVLRSHIRRTAANSAGYLLGSIQLNMRILDVGCGPGSISADLAALVPDGQVVAIDNGPEAIEKARSMAAERGLKNLKFETGDANCLVYPHGTFDVVHSHQVLQHLADPIHALREFSRVTKKGGLVACREADMTAVSYYPDTQGIKDFHDFYVQVARSYGGHPDGGRKVVAWALHAGFERSSITATSSVWCYSDPEERAWWSGLWADRLVKSSFANNAIDGGHATQQDIDRLVEAWRIWGGRDDAWYALLHGEILCRVS